MSVEINLELFWFTLLCDWSKKKFAPRSPPIECKIKTKCYLVTGAFPRLKFSHKSRLWSEFLLTELADRSPIIIQNSSNPSSRKNLVVRPYDKVLLLTYVVNCTAGTPTPRLCPVVQWSVHWAPSRTTRVRCALETCGKKKCELRF